MNISSFIWNIADDVLRDIYVRGKYRDAILPMTVIRRLDGILEETKEAVIKMKAQLDEAGVTNQEAALCQASGEAFFNTSPYKLRDLTSRGQPQKLRSDFEAYLDGFSANVQEILDKFKFRNQIDTLIDADVLGHLIEKFLDTSINLSPKPVLGPDGEVIIAGLDNHAMGTIFEELIRKFNEANNEEAGEHWTPRDVVQLMSQLIFKPVTDEIESGTYLVYDGACGTGGMLTVAEKSLKQLAVDHGKDVSIHIFGQEINPETYAIAKADLLLKGEGAEADNIAFGSTLSNDGFRSRAFDFMLSNPPYGKSWKTDLERLGGKSELKDHRFVVDHDGDPEYSMVTRTSDGQLMFLASKLSKMKRDTPLGSRIAEVHNGSSLFRGDAGQGESQIRQWIIENDWLDAIIALPLNIFYNTGIATYIWVLANRKAPERKGKIQLIDATEWFVPLRKNLGKKNCELQPGDIRKICDAYLEMQENEHSKIFPNAAFGYWKVTVDRPLRLRSQFSRQSVEGLRFANGDEELRRAIYAEHGASLYDAFAKLRPEIEAWLKGDDEDSEEDGDSDEPKRPTVPEKKRKKLLNQDTWFRDRKLVDAARSLSAEMGDEVFPDHNVFRLEFDTTAKALGIKLTAAEKKLIQRGVSWCDPDAPAVVKKKKRRTGKSDPKLDALYGTYNQDIDGKPVSIEYEPDTDLRDTEQVSFLQDGGIEEFIKREVLPHASDAWIDGSKTKIGYEISFARHFYKPVPLRELSEIEIDIRAIEKETVGLLEGALVECD